MPVLVLPRPTGPSPSLLLLLLLPVSLLLLLLLLLLPPLVSLVADEDEAASFPPEDDRRVGAGLLAVFVPEATGTAAAPPILPAPDAPAFTMTSSSSFSAPPEEEVDDNRRRLRGLSPLPVAVLAPDVLEMVLLAAPAAAAVSPSLSLSLPLLSSLDKVRAWVVAARLCSSSIRVRSSL